MAFARRLWAMRWMISVALLLPHAAWGGDCHVSNVVMPERLEGRTGEIIILSDRSTWEVSSGPGSLGRRRGEVIVCPSSEEMGVGAEVLRVRRVERSLAAEGERASSIESTIRGGFTGWRGNAEFRLANGQLWRQVQGGHSSGAKNDPKVHLSRKADGVYEMRVEGFTGTVNVIRIR